MKEALYGWMKNLAVFYILFTAFLHLIPDKKYEKYVRLFMGLMLICMMSTPLVSLLGKGTEIMESFHGNYRAESENLVQKELEELQIICMKQGYEWEIRRKIMEAAENAGINLRDAAVHIEGERVSAVLCVQEEVTAQQERGLMDALWKEWGIGEGELEMEFTVYGENAVDRTSAAGTSVGSGSHAGFS